MKLVTALLATLVSVVAAQRIQIYQPKNGQTLTAGEQLTISLVEPNSQTSVSEIGIGIVAEHCTTNPCDGKDIAHILYTGGYQPKFDAATENMPNQNFTVTIPANIGSGPMLLSVEHASLLGASATFFSENINVTVNIK